MSLPVVLIADKLAASTVEALGDQVDVRWVDGPDREKLLAAVVDADALLVRSATTVDAEVLAAAPRLKIVARAGVGLDNVDVDAATARGVLVVNAPTSNIHSAAEHAVALILTLNRKTHRAYNRVREGNFLLRGLCGFDLRGKTVAVIGTGKIGAVFAKIMAGFECRLLGHDPQENPDCLALGMTYAPLDECLREADMVSLHCPLMPATRHLINDAAVQSMKPGVMIINTGRGGLIDTRAAIAGLKSGRIGALGLDVYEEEEQLFFEDRSTDVIQDDVFMRLLTFPNVLVTGHQGFFTDEALRGIAETTMQNITAFESGEGELHKVEA